MELQKFLSENRAEILEQWQQFALERYSRDFSRFFKKNSDPFTNPVGYNIVRSLDFLYGILSGESDEGKLDSVLDDLIRIRAIQEMSPSEALSFLVQLKSILKDMADRLGVAADLGADLDGLNRKVDEILLRSFDIYSKCREQVFQIKLDEFRKGVFLHEDENASCPSTLMDSWSTDSKKIEAESCNH